MNAIDAELKRRSAREEKITTEIKHSEAGLEKNIKNLCECYSSVKIKEILGVLDREAVIQRSIQDPPTVFSNSSVLEILDSADVIQQIMKIKGGGYRNFLKRYQNVNARLLYGFLLAQKAYSQIDPLPENQVIAMRFFKSFYPQHLEILRRKIEAYHSIRLPVFGFTFSKVRARKLDEDLRKDLSVVNALNAHQKLSMLEDAHSAFSSLTVMLSKKGLQSPLHTFVFAQVAEGVEPLESMVDEGLKATDIICRLAKPDSNLSKVLRINLDAIADWAFDDTGVGAIWFKNILAYARSLKQVQDKFAAAPMFSYVEDKGKLERLHAERLAYVIDKSVVEFARHNKNDAIAIRDLIRKKQRFPKEKFEALKRAFPIIISGIRDYAEYVPLEKNLFDIVIIDEASQVSIAQAFPAIVRAKKVVVLGDQKQFSNVKTSTASIEINNKYQNDIIQQFRMEHEVNADTLNRLKLFNIKTSVLQFVNRIANSQIMLRKHFRGYRELISFSSKTFYDDGLQSIKIRGISINKVIKFSHVKHDGKMELRKNTNELEYQAILEELRRLVAELTPQTVGVITPFTEQQAYIVEKLGREPDGDVISDKLQIKVMTFDFMSRRGAGYHYLFDGR